MKYTFFFITLVIIGYGGYVYVTNEAVDSELAVTTEQDVRVVPELVFRTETNEFMYPGGTAVLDYEVPYVVYGSDDEVRIFSEEQARVDYSLESPLGDYVYFSKGIGRQDASVTPYVFDVNNRTLHKVCVSSEVCEDSYSGFGEQHLLDVSWEKDMLTIVYDNPFLPEGVGESGSAIGLQVFKSVSAETPWIIEEVN